MNDQSDHSWCFGDSEGRDGRDDEDERQDSHHHWHINCVASIVFNDFPLDFIALTSCPLFRRSFACPFAPCSHRLRFWVTACCSETSFSRFPLSFDCSLDCFPKLFLDSSWIRCFFPWFSNFQNVFIVSFHHPLVEIFIVFRNFQFFSILFQLLQNRKVVALLLFIRCPLIGISSQFQRSIIFDSSLTVLQSSKIVPNHP